jgi:anti-sigma factor RsiW
MSLDHLTSLLAAGAAANSMRSPACPDEHGIAGYVDGRLDEAERPQVELHLADCGRCLALVGLLSRERTSGATESVADEVAVQARASSTSGSRARWRLAPWWAAAATLVLAVPWLSQLGRNLDGTTEGQGRPAPPATRSVTPVAEGLQVLSPTAGTTVDARLLSFRWTAVAGTPFYDVRIVTDAGDVVTQQRVTGTTWQPPPQLNLQPGAEYFVHVDAYPSGDKAVSSDHVPFRISD